MQTFIAPHAGAIVWGRIPEAEDVFGEEGKVRPCLVLEQGVRADGTPEILVAYGTSRRVNQIGSGEFTLDPREVPSLPTATKFCLPRRVWLPLTEEHFPQGRQQGRCDVLGQVPKSAMRRFYVAATEAGLV